MESCQGKKLLLMVGNITLSRQPTQKELNGKFGQSLSHNNMSCFFLYLTKLSVDILASVLCHYSCLWVSVSSASCWTLFLLFVSFYSEALVLFFLIILYYYSLEDCFLMRDWKWLNRNRREVGKNWEEQREGKSSSGYISCERNLFSIQGENMIFVLLLGMPTKT